MYSTFQHCVPIQVNLKNLVIFVLVWLGCRLHQSKFDRIVLKSLLRVTLTAIHNCLQLSIHHTARVYARCAHLFPIVPYLLLIVLLNGSLERLWVCTNNFGNFLSVLEQQKCRHGADSEFLCYIWHVIDIELVKPGVCKFVGESRHM